MFFKFLLVFLKVNIVIIFLYEDSDNLTVFAMLRLTEQVCYYKRNLACIVSDAQLLGWACWHVDGHHCVAVVLKYHFGSGDELISRSTYLIDFWTCLSSIGQCSNCLSASSFQNFCDSTFLCAVHYFRANRSIFPRRCSQHYGLASGNLRRHPQHQSCAWKDSSSSWHIETHPLNWPDLSSASDPWHGLHHGWLLDLSQVEFPNVFISYIESLFILCADSIIGQISDIDYEIFLWNIYSIKLGG